MKKPHTSLKLIASYSFIPLVLLLFASSIGTTVKTSAPGMTDPLEILSRMEREYAKINDYTANFRKKERVKGKVLPEENILLKFRKPFRVYMKWLDGPHEGREAMYVQGRYVDKVVGHEGGIISFITLHMD